jgi:hypothetical protein
MPCRAWEEDAQITELLRVHPVTPTKQQGNLNDGAGHDNSDAEIPVTQSDKEEELLPKKKRKRVLATYEAVQRWVTGDRAKQPEEDIEQLILEQERLLMHLSRLKKIPGHNSLETDLDLWKRAGGHTSNYLKYAPIVSIHVILHDTDVPATQFSCAQLRRNMQ